MANYPSVNKGRLSLCALVLCFTAPGATADGGVYILPYGQVIDRSGNIVSEGNTVSGESGDSIVGTDGKVYSAQELRVDNRGELVTRSGETFEAKKRPTTANYAYPNISKNFTSSSSTANARTGSAPVGASGKQSQSRRSSSDASDRQSGADKPRRQYAGPGVELVVGGSSENGVSRIGKLPIIP